MAMASPYRPDDAFNKKYGKDYGKRGFAGNRAQIGMKGYPDQEMIAMIHEPFHLLGLSDRDGQVSQPPSEYEENGMRLGFGNDILGTTTLNNSNWNINQVHINNWAKFSLTEQRRLIAEGRDGNEFVIKHFVDRSAQTGLIGNYKRESNGAIVLDPN